MFPIPSRGEPATLPLAGPDFSSNNTNLLVKEKAGKGGPQTWCIICLPGFFLESTPYPGGVSYLNICHHSGIRQWCRASHVQFPKRKEDMTRFGPSQRFATWWMVESETQHGPWTPPDAGQREAVTVTHAWSGEA